MSKYRNDDGSYNGARELADMSGISEAEVLWTFTRLRHYLVTERLSKDEARRRVAEEAKARPW